MVSTLLCHSSGPLAGAMLTWRTSWSTLGAGGSGRLTLPRRSLDQRQIGRGLRPRRRLEPGHHAATGHVAAAADCRHVDQALLTVGQQEPIGGHEDRSQIDRIDEPSGRAAASASKAVGSIGRLANSIIPPPAEVARAPARSARDRRRRGTCRGACRQAAAAIGPFLVPAGKPPANIPLAAARGRQFSPPR